jgi:hypothetical protein
MFIAFIKKAIAEGNVSKVVWTIAALDALLYVAVFWAGYVIGGGVQ